MDSYRLYLTARIAYAISWTVMVTLNLVYMVEVAGLDPLQMVLVGTALELSVFLFEIPTGVVADRVSRRLSVIIGHFLIGAGFLIITFAPTFEVILLSQLIWGFGWTFISGAYPAWLTSEVGVTRANQAMLRASQLAHVAAFLGIGLAIALAHFSLRLPIAAGALGMVGVAALLIMFMREDNFTPAGGDDQATWSGLAMTFAAGARAVGTRPVLILMLAVTVVFGLFSEGLDRLFTPLMIHSFQFPPLGSMDTVVWWGVIAAVGNLAGLGATTLARQSVDLRRQKALTGVLAGCLGGISVLVLLLANLSNFYLVLACFWLVGALRSAYDPLMSAWLNGLFPESNRATLFSLFGQADSAGQVVGGPMIGSLARQFGIGFGLSVSALLLLPAIPVFKKIATLLDRGGETHV